MAKDMFIIPHIDNDNILQNKFGWSQNLVQKEENYYDEDLSFFKISRYHKSI